MKHPLGYYHRILLLGGFVVFFAGVYGFSCQAKGSYLANASAPSSTPASPASVLKQPTRPPTPIGAIKLVFTPDGNVATGHPAAASARSERKALTNGDFEQGPLAWSHYTAGAWSNRQKLIGAQGEGFEVYRGNYAARLGGFPAIQDAITQTVTVPLQGQFTFWWRVSSDEILPHTDRLRVELLNPDGSLAALLAQRDDRDASATWRQDSVDVSAFAGQTLTLSFASYNDSYYPTIFLFDDVELRSANFPHE